MTKIIVKEAIYIAIVTIVPLIILWIAIAKRKKNRKVVITIVGILIIATYAIFAKSLIYSAERIVHTISVQDKRNIRLEKIDDNKTFLKKDRKYSIVFLIIGILGLISIPFLAEWQQKKNMELFKTAYEHSYDYIFEYPLSIILILALMFIGLGICFISKKKRRRFDEKND